MAFLKSNMAAHLIDKLIAFFDFWASTVFAVWGSFFNQEIINIILFSPLLIAHVSAISLEDNPLKSFPRTLFAEHLLAGMFEFVYVRRTCSQARFWLLIAHKFTIAILATNPIVVLRQIDHKQTTFHALNF